MQGCQTQSLKGPYKKINTNSRAKQGLRFKLFQKRIITFLTFENKCYMSLNMKYMIFVYIKQTKGIRKPKKPWSEKFN